MNNSGEELYELLYDLAEKNRANQFKLCDDVRQIITTIDSETLTEIVQRIANSTNNAGWVSMKSALIGVKWTLEEELKGRSKYI